MEQLDVQVFAPLTGNSSLQNNQVGNVRPSAVRFTENLFAPGSFEMELSGYEPYAERLRQGYLVRVRFGALSLWGIIRGIEDTDDGGTIPLVRSGDDLKGYLKQRICLYASTGDLAGFDAVQGSTETVMQHYVRNNAVSPSDIRRVIPQLTLAPDRHRGLQNDRYLARFNKLTDVLEEVGQAQKIGYKVDMDLDAHQMVFDVIEGVDRTAGQSDRPRIVLDVNLRTAKNSHHVSDTENYRNLFYTTKSGANTEAEATTLTFWREGEAEPASVERFETQISVTVDPTAVDIAGEMQNLAAKQMTNFERDDTFTLELNSAYIYGKDFFLGDLVTIQDRFLQISEDVQLISVTHEWQGINYRITGTFGNPRKTNFDIIERQLKTEGGR